MTCLGPLRADTPVCAGSICSRLLVLGFYQFTLPNRLFLLLCGTLLLRILIHFNYLLTLKTKQKNKRALSFISLQLSPNSLLTFRAKFLLSSCL